MEEGRILWTLIIVIAACSIIGTWSGLKDMAKGLLSVFRRD